MIKKILIITFVFLTFSCLGMQDKIDQQKLDLIKEKGLRWYLISKINWQEQNEQRNFPELLCDLIAAYADNQQSLTDEIKIWLVKNIEIPFKENTQIEKMLICFDMFVSNPHKPDELAGIAGPNGCGISSGISILNRSKRIKHFADSTGKVCSLAYNPHNPKELASGSVDKTIRIWNTDTGEEIKKLTGHEHFVNALIYNPHKPNELASGSTDKTVLIWNIDTGEKIKKLTCHTDWVSALAYNPCKSNELASGSRDKTIRIWNTDTGEEIKQLTDHDWVWKLAYNPHKPDELASRSYRYTQHTWDLSNLRKAQRICVNPSMEEAKLIAKVYKAKQEKKCELDEEEQKIVDDLHLKMNIHD